MFFLYNYRIVLKTFLMDWLLPKFQIISPEMRVCLFFFFDPFLESHKDKKNGI